VINVSNKENPIVFEITTNHGAVIGITSKRSNEADSDNYMNFYFKHLHKLLTDSFNKNLNFKDKLLQFIAHFSKTNNFCIYSGQH
jgi:hypothetical protein